MYKIYLLRSLDIDNSFIYKIGITKRSVSKRLKEFKTGNVTDIEVVSVFETDKYVFSIEKTLHHKYKHLHIKGEWFSLTDKEVIPFLETCKSIKNNFDLLSNTSTLNIKFP